MSTNDEKRAFDAMLAEISDSDEDEASSKGISPSYAADSKPYPTSSSQMKGTVVAVSYKGGSMSKEDEEIANFGVQSEIDASQVKAEQISITKRWLTRPFSKSERNAMKCYVDRERGSFGMQTIYRCYLESNDPNQAARFMMAAKKKVANKTSYYLVTVDPNPDDRGSDTVLGMTQDLFI